MKLAADREAPRDLAGARAGFAQAAAEGDVRAAHIYAGFLAGGIGGPRDWPAAVSILREWACRDPVAAQQTALIDAMDLTPAGDPSSVPPPRPLHPRKHVALIEGMLSHAECEFLIKIASPRLQPATVLSSPAKATKKPVIRDADHASFSALEEPPFLHAINRRIARATETDVRQGEPLQLIRYAPGQQYRPHVDGVGGGSNKRQLTAITYLNDDYRGGETTFTELGLTVRGRRGDLLLFGNLLESGALDREMRHAGLPVTAGIKFIASRWILERPPYDEQGNALGETFWSI